MTDPAERGLLRRVDARFLLPAAPGTAATHDPSWRLGLERAGVRIVDPAAGPELEVRVGPLRRRPESQARMQIFEGAPLLGGIQRRIFAALPRPGRAELIVPLDRRVPLDYVFRNWVRSPSAWKEVRNTLLHRLLAAAPRAAAPLTTSVVADGTVPHLVAETKRLGLEPGSDFFVTLSEHPDGRCAFHLFPPGEPAPAWVLKFTRLPGDWSKHDAEERGLRLAAAAGGEVAHHAPTLLGRIEAAPVPATVETAADGMRLTTLLTAAGAGGDRLAAIERVASWIVELGRATAVGPDALAPELARLEGLGGAELVRSLPALPAVLQHNDLGGWNIVVDGERFTVVDWESAREHGLPLWDLLYFLTDTLTLLESAGSPSQRAAAAIELFQGRLRSSDVLFRWLGHAVRALDVPREAVGALATLCWLHHGGQSLDRQQLRPSLPSIEQLAELWLREPNLGVNWQPPLAD